MWFPHWSSSEEDGNDTILRSRNFRVSVAYRLGVPLFKGVVNCTMCKQTIDVYGDHATCCASTGDLITRHNSIRNLMDKLASEGLLSPIMEKKGILGPTSGRRPGDVTIPLWSQGKGLAIDESLQSEGREVVEPLRGLRRPTETWQVRRQLPRQELLVRSCSIRDHRGHQRGRREFLAN